MEEKFICPKCGNEENLHFNYDYSKKEQPIIDVLCNECGEFFKMKKFKFEDLQLISVSDIYVVTYNNKIITLDGKTTFSTIVNAKNRLQKVLTINYHQGHYWHEGKENTFSYEGGHMRNGGIMYGFDEIFKNLGKQLTNELLNNGVFVIKKNTINNILVVLVYNNIIYNGIVCDIIELETKHTC